MQNLRIGAVSQYIAIIVLIIASLIAGQFIIQFASTLNPTQGAILSGVAVARTDSSGSYIAIEIKLTNLGDRDIRLCPSGATPQPFFAIDNSTLRVSPYRAFGSGPDLGDHQFYITSDIYVVNSPSRCNGLSIKPQETVSIYVFARGVGISRGTSLSIYINYIDLGSGRLSSLSLPSVTVR